MLNNLMTQSATSNSFQAIYKDFVKDQASLAQKAKDKVGGLCAAVTPLSPHVVVSDYLEWMGEMVYFSIDAPY